MKIITGGRYNGKLEYVMDSLGFSEPDILDLKNISVPEAAAAINNYPVLYHLESFIKKALLDKADYDSVIKDYVAARPDCVIICDEVGSGVVPVEREDDEWREAVGRTMCRLAETAGGIIRVTYGTAEELSYAT